MSESECESYDQVAEAGNPCGHMPPESESESEHPYEKEDKGGSLVAVSVKEAEHVEAARSKLQISPPRTFKRSNAAIWEEKIEPVVFKKPKTKGAAKAGPSTPPQPLAGDVAAGSGAEKKKKQKKSDLVGECFEAIRESFSEEYRPVLSILPFALQPSSTRHGQHSYTKLIGSARIEVLLRQRALKPKNTVDGSQIQTKSVSFAPDNVGEVCKRAFLMCGLTDQGEVPAAVE